MEDLNTTNLWRGDAVDLVLGDLDNVGSQWWLQPGGEGGNGFGLLLLLISVALF